MALRIHKYGGTSVDGPEKIHAAAGRIAADADGGHKVLVVVSAAGQTTDRLEAMALAVCPDPPRREMDMLVTTGERISMALLAMALHARGVRAISFTGSQSGIITDDRHQDARIETIRPSRILQELERGQVVIVAGFQGVSRAKEITTLGRGGSDTTAAALAIVFGAPWCGIYTDAPGVMTADPRIVPSARVVPKLSLEAMAHLSRLGAGVLSHRAALLARKFGQPLLVAHAHTKEPGTWVLPSPAADPPGDPERMPLAVTEVDALESENILSVTLCRPVWRMTAPIFATTWPHWSGRGRPLYIQEDTTAQGNSRLSAVIDGSPPAELPADVRVEKDLALVSLVGEGGMCDPNRLAHGRRVVEAMGCPVLGAFAQGFALSFLIPQGSAEEVVNAFHKAFIAPPGH
jgi:aspartate kinase